MSAPGPYVLSSTCLRLRPDSSVEPIEAGGGEKVVELNESCAYVVVPRGTWHTSRTRNACRMLFITPGEGTQIRPIKA